MTLLVKLIEQEAPQSRLYDMAKTLTSSKGDDDLKGQVRDFRNEHANVKFTKEEEDLLNKIEKGAVTYDDSAEKANASEGSDEYISAGDMANPDASVPPINEAEARYDDQPMTDKIDRDAIREKNEKIKEEKAEDRDPKDADAPLTNTENIPGDDNRDGVKDSKQQYPESIK